MDGDVEIVPFEPRYSARIEAWSSQNAVKTLLKLPEATLPSAQDSGHQAWVALIKDEPVALATINFNEQRIAYLNILVKPNERNQGIGSQLIEFVLSQPSVKAIHRLHALVDRDNTAAQKILEREHFSRVGYGVEDGRLEFSKH
jgi:RimJ/RimL family protein N-acetyltransferase